MADDTPKRHAPQGPKIKRDPIGGSDPMSGACERCGLSHPRCKGHNKAGKPCGHMAIRGGVVCRLHGGSAPQVQAKAMERLMALQHPAINRLQQLISQTEFPTVAYAASRDVLDRTIGKPKETTTVEHSGGITIKHEL